MNLIFKSWFGGPLEYSLNGIGRHIYHINGLNKELDLGCKIEQYSNTTGFLEDYIELFNNFNELNYEISRKYEGCMNLKKELMILEMNLLNNCYYNKMREYNTLEPRINNFEKEQILIKKINEFFIIHEIKPLKGIESLQILPDWDGCNEWGYVVKCPICKSKTYGLLSELDFLNTCICDECIQKMVAKHKIRVIIKMKKGINEFSICVSKLVAPVA
jgi:hypothetical protein